MYRSANMLLTKKKGRGDIEKEKNGKERTTRKKERKKIMHASFHRAEREHRRKCPLAGV